MITVEELRERVSVNPESDHELSLLRDTVVSLWEDATGSLWDKTASDTVLIRANNSRQTSIWLPRRPVTALTTVEERAEGESTWTTLDSDSYFLTNDVLGEVERINRYWKTHVRVTYTAGYDETTAPADIRQALFIQARFMVERYEGEKLTVKGQSLGKGTATFLESADLHPLFRRVARMHRRASYL